MVYQKIEEKTPNGGDYSEIYYFDDDNNLIDEKLATKCVIRECKKNGELVNEIWGRCN